MKLAILGLDCAAPRLVFERFRDDLPNLKALMAGGCHGPLLSTHPPITVPAWACMMSSRDPGQLGIYGFRNRKDHSYDGYAMANASVLGDEAIWHGLGRAGRQVIVLGVPPSYPPRPLNGVQVGCFLTPSTDRPYTHPPELRQEIERVAPGYVVDVEGFRTDDKEALLGRIYDKTRKHFAVARHLLKTRPWDFFMMVEMGVDRIHHSFWKYMDPEHPKHEPGNRFEDAIRQYYRHCDQELGEVISLMPKDTAILVVSDHGAKKLDGGICFNEWLIRKGYLTLKSYPDKSTPIGKAEIDWSKTKAWGDGGYYGRLFLNVKGREPQGTIDPRDYDKVRSDLIAQIEAIEDPSGRLIGSRAHRPEDLYREVRGVAPDLIAYFGNLDWRSIGSVGLKTIHTFENDTGPDDANHDWHGIFIMRSGSSREPKGELRGLRIYDVAPTVLDLLGVERPAGMIGRSLLG
ncbi:MAG TPA: alkaline phosphatase family protein [Candidatus Polarisedimenticolia bacterium]|nr:alkaline phosphatase family protein [Candidatus Polarisedimenticolia bacterium]